MGVPTSDGPAPDVHYAGPPEEWVELMRQRDELRVENVRLRALVREYETRAAVADPQFRPKVDD